MTPRRSHWSFAASSRRPSQSAGSDQIVGRDMRASAAPPGDSCTGFEDSWCAAAGLLSTPGCPCNGSASQRFMRACACCRRARKNIRAKSLDLMWLVSSGICFSGLKVRDWQNFLRLTNSLLGKERGLCCWQSFLTTALLKSFACPFLSDFTLAIKQVDQVQQSCQIKVKLGDHVPWQQFASDWKQPLLVYMVCLQSQRAVAVCEVGVEIQASLRAITHSQTKNIIEDTLQTRTDPESERGSH